VTPTCSSSRGYHQFGGKKEALHSLDALTGQTPVCAVFGNCDHKEVALALEERGISVHGRSATFGEVVVTGCQAPPASPFGTPGEYDEDELRALLVPPPAGRTSVLVSHAPAFGTALDIAPAAGHIGSHAIRDYILATRPALHVCGHVHEAAGIDRLMGTLLVNPGPFFEGRYAEIDLVPESPHGRAQKEVISSRAEGNTGGNRHQAPGECPL
jgi:Icc-related predicted phosphoesterase